MEITITIEDHELTKSDKTLIQECLGLAESDVSSALTKLSKTAFMEYVKMFKEKGIPTRADEVQQERLYFLLNYFYENRLPNESDISSIFQLTPSQSRTLLRNTKSRYRTKISEFIKNTLRDTVNSSTPANDESGYRFICTSPSTIEELNSIVSQKGPGLKPIEKIRGLSSVYSCAIDTYNLLQNELI
jgi:hypothetical protein